MNNRARWAQEDDMTKTTKTPAKRAKKSTLHPYRIGQAYLIRTVTHYWTGRLIEVFPGELVITDAAWIADTGRWHVAMASGVLSEVEPMPAGAVVIVSRGAIVDICEWAHALPKVAQ